MVLSSEQVKAKALDIGFHLVGIASAEAEQQDGLGAHLQAWLALGYQADMAWMANPRRQSLKALMPEARSVIALALNYYTPHQRPTGPEFGKIARYGWGRDYHKVMTKRLKILAHWLESQVPGTQTRYYVDTGPISDKAWAQRAGLGWIAKNGNLITRQYGSWVFLGEIVTDLALEPDIPHTQHCGTCRRCLEACPTQAIPQPFWVDARRCIAYHTIENRAEHLPPAVQENLQGWVAGCDVCQDVCPWNERFAQETTIEDFQPYPEQVAPRLQALANLSDEDWQMRFPSSALRRIKPAMWRRNARANLERSPSQKVIPPTNDH
ncbi:tRNA epoxyqueuosine(34) reductase QueG [Synechocystis sp. LKSZ1]|uniref:tRNA epoxyqueuosine(34) reductase QueG n=1 Tax=Synechocystis sp. LKSZ1 TaxID=3144951 RepID=UPI00336BCA88